MPKAVSYNRNEAIRLYLSGLTIAEVSKRIGIGSTTLRDHFDQRGIKRRSGKELRKLSPAIELELCQRYVAGETATKLAADHAISIGLITRILKRNGFKRREWSDIHRHHDCDHAFFENINSEEKAYWLGFIAADGYISKPQRGSPELHVALATKDEGHLIALKKALQSDHPIRHYDYSSTSETGRPYASFSVRSAQLTADLARFGIVSRKCHTFKWPELSPTVQRHFLRGYFDGDGCWNIKASYNKTTGERVDKWRPGIAFRLTSDRCFLRGCQEYLEQTCCLSRTKLSDRYHKGKYSASTLIYSGRKNCRKLFHLMYDDATIYLSRKYERVAPHILWLVARTGQGTPPQSIEKAPLAKLRGALELL